MHGTHNIVHATEAHTVQHSWHKSSFDFPLSLFINPKAVQMGEEQSKLSPPDKQIITAAAQSDLVGDDPRAQRLRNDYDDDGLFMMSGALDPPNEIIDISVLCDDEQEHLAYNNAPSPSGEKSAQDASSHHRSEDELSSDNELLSDGEQGLSTSKEDEASAFSSDDAYSSDEDDYDNSGTWLPGTDEVRAVEWSDRLPFYENLTYYDILTGNKALYLSVDMRTTLLAFCARHQISERNKPSPALLINLLDDMQVPQHSSTRVWSNLARKILSAIKTQISNSPRNQALKESQCRNGEWICTWEGWSEKWFTDADWKGDISKPKTFPSRPKRPVVKQRHTFGVEKLIEMAAKMRKRVNHDETLSSGRATHAASVEKTGLWRQSRHSSERSTRRLRSEGLADDECSKELLDQDYEADDDEADEPDDDEPDEADDDESDEADDDEPDEADDDESDEADDDEPDEAEDDEPDEAEDDEPDEADHNDPDEAESDNSEVDESTDDELDTDELSQDGTDEASSDDGIVSQEPCSEGGFEEGDEEFLQAELDDDRFGTEDVVVTRQNTVSQKGIGNRISNDHRYSGAESECDASSHNRSGEENSARPELEQHQSAEHSSEESHEAKFQKSQRMENNFGNESPRRPGLHHGEEYNSDDHDAADPSDNTSDMGINAANNFNSTSVVQSAVGSSRRAPSTSKQAAGNGGSASARVFTTPTSSLGPNARASPDRTTSQSGYRGQDHANNAATTVPIVERTKQRWDSWLAAANANAHVPSTRGDYDDEDLEEWL